MTSEPTNERAPNTGIFINDYAQSRWDDILEYADDVASKIKLPHQNDEWGCITATGSFIINQLNGSEVVTPSELDIAINREPNKSGDEPLVTLEMFKRGLSSEIYKPYSPLDEPAKLLVNGTINLDTYIEIYQEHMGKIDESYMSRFIDYYQNVFIPSALAIGKRFENHEETGQMIIHESHPITKTLVTSLVDDGKYIYASQLGSGTTHAVAIFRPQLSMPALVFVPELKDTDPESGSTIDILSQNGFNRINQSAIGALALWNS